MANIGAEFRLKAGFGYDQKEKSTKAGGYPIDFVGAGLGDQARLRWDFDDGSPADTTTTTPTHEYSSTGTYNVCYEIFDPVNEQTDKVCEDVTVTGDPIIEPHVKTTRLAQILNAFPNPVANQLTIEYTMKQAGYANVKIVDIDGRTVKILVNNYKQQGSYNIGIETSTLNPGAYMVIFNTSYGAGEQKLILKK